MNDAIALKRKGITGAVLILIRSAHFFHFSLLLIALKTDRHATTADMQLSSNTQKSQS